MWLVIFALRFPSVPLSSELLACITWRLVVPVIGTFARREVGPSARVARCGTGDAPRAFPWLCHRQSGAAPSPPTTKASPPIARAANSPDNLHLPVGVGRWRHERRVCPWHLPGRGPVIGDNRWLHSAHVRECNHPIKVMCRLLRSRNTGTHSIRVGQRRHADRTRPRVLVAHRARTRLLRLRHTRL